MKISAESPELTAYVLNELPEAERAAVEAAIAASPDLAAEVEQLRAASTLLSRHLASEPAVELEPIQREDILLGGGRRSIPRPVQATGSSRQGDHSEPRLSTWIRALNQQWIWATAAAAALMLTLTLWPRQQSAEIRLNELRYQRRPSLEVESDSTPPPRTAPPSVAPETRPAPPSVVTPTPTTSGVVPTRATAQLDSSAVAAVNAQRRGIAPQVPVPSSPDNVYSMDPVLARRYGLLPRRSVEVAPQSEPSLQPLPRTRQSAANPSPKPLALAAADPAAPEQKVALGERLTVAQHGIPNGPVGLSIAPADRYGDRPGPDTGTEDYASITDNPFKSPATAPLSTFSLDVDTASYANVRRFLREGSLPPVDAVRIEELINYFQYDYPSSRGNDPLASVIEIADCPWRDGHKLVRIGLQAASIDRGERPRANLVFLVDVSGSMQPENKLPLVKRSLRLLLDRLGQNDAVSIVTYAGESRIALEPTTVSDAGRQRIVGVLEGLRAGSGTAGSAGIQDAYRLATNHFIAGGVNRVLLCTDGDFNIGITDHGALHQLIEEKARSGVFLSVLGYGMGNTKDSTMELLADKGNGNYAYVDSFAEARKVLGEQLEGTLVTIAKDVKVQVEFNPGRVRSYRLIGYENRQLRDRDFNDDTRDAGEVGAGHQVTVLYEIEPAVPDRTGTDPLRYQPRPVPEGPPVTLKAGHGDELLNLKIRYKAPDGDQSRLIEKPVKDASKEFMHAGSDFKFTAAVAGYGMLLRNSPHRGDLTWDAVLRLAEQGVGTDREGYRAEFVDLARKAQQLSGRP